MSAYASDSKTSEVALVWVPESHLKIHDALDLYGEKNIAGWTGEERAARRVDGAPDPPWEWDSANRFSTTEFFIVTEGARRQTVEEAEALEWWQRIYPVLLEEGRLENAAYDR